MWWNARLKFEDREVAGSDSESEWGESYMYQEDYSISDHSSPCYFTKLWVNS